MNLQNNPLRRQPQQKRSQERVEKILDAAAIVFDEMGFEAATTHAIAARANTAIGSLYQFFPDKLAIFNALELRHVERVHVIWETLLRPQIIQLSFGDFIHTMVSQFQRLFEQPTSRIIFIQFFTSPTIFKNIDSSFTTEAIQYTARLFQERNHNLTEQRSELLAEICVHSFNTLIFLALRSDISHRQNIFNEIETILKAYLKNDIGDSPITNNLNQIRKKIARLYQLNYRQNLILDYALSNSEVTIKDCEAILPDVSRRTLQRDLKAMLEQKLLLPQGNTDRRFYRIDNKFLDS